MSASSPDSAVLLMCHVLRWIASRISEILGDEDDIVIELCFNLLEGSRYVGPFDHIAVHLRFPENCANMLLNG